MRVLFLSDIEPNLALMKLARYEVERGNRVYLYCPNPSRIYLSCVFDKNKYQEIIMNGAEFLRGGRAIDPLFDLPRCVEHLKPYYDLYNLDFSMGFTSRGCIRRCLFCDNWRREGGIRVHASVSEFWDEGHDKVVVLDNNFLASPKWKENTELIREHDLRVNFHQGLDIRLVDDEVAKKLSGIKIENYRGSKGNIHFAFDDLRIKRQVIAGVERLDNHGFNIRDFIFYMIVGFYSKDIAYDLERIRILKELGCQPHPMVYETATRLQRKLARWILKTHRWRSEKFSQYKNLGLKEKALVEKAEKELGI